MHTLLHVAICDDTNSDADLLVKLIHCSGFLVKTAVFHSGEDFIQSYDSIKYDLIFMDIYMPGMSGIETVTKIRQKDETALVAFTTNSIDHTLESYRLGVLKYIEKPATPKIINQLLRMAESKQKNFHSITLLINSKEQLIPLNKIIYFEQKKQLVQVNTVGMSCYTEAKLSDIELKLSCPPFFRSHQSYIVNLHYVRLLDKELKVFTMLNGENAYIRRESLKAAQNSYENYLFSLVRDTHYDF